jgi:hypothetical protein
MRTYPMCSLALAAFAGCSGIPERNRTHDDGANRPQANLSGKNNIVYECSLNQNDRKGGCNAIPVLVLPRKNNGCIAIVPFDKLFVNVRVANGSPQEEPVTWRIVSLQDDPDGPYTFKKNGVALSASGPNDAYAQAQAIWNSDDANGAGTDHYTWTLHKGANEASISPSNQQLRIEFALNVKDKNGYSCEEIDPVIGNGKNQP